MTAPPVCTATPPFDPLSARTLMLGEGADPTLDRFELHLPGCPACSAAVADLRGPPPDAAVGDAMAAWAAVRRTTPAAELRLDARAVQAYDAVEAALAEAGFSELPPLPQALATRAELTRVLSDHPSTARVLRTEDGCYGLARLDLRRFLVLGHGVDDPWGLSVRVVARKDGELDRIVEGQVTKAGVLTLRPEEPDLTELVDAGFRLELLLL